MKVFANSESTITCPYQLGLLHEDLNPYDISWIIVEGENVLPANTSQVSISNKANNIMFSELRVPASELDSTAMYRCTLMLRRCETLDETNQPTEVRRCGQSIYTSPEITMTIYGKIYNCTYFLTGSTKLIFRARASYASRNRSHSICW